MKLYYFPGACSLAPHIALREAGLPFTLERVDLDTKRTETGADFRIVNPKGYVPALVLDDGQVLTEAQVVLIYIGDRKPELGLSPAVDTMHRYRMMEWLGFTATELHKQFSPLWNPEISARAREDTVTLLARRFDYLAPALGERPYVMRDRFTVADAYLFAVLGWCNFLNVDLSKWPVLVAYVARIADRPAVRAALQAEGLIQ